METDIFSFLGPPLVAASLGFAFLAGFIKGVVGFALPMILIAGLGSFLPAEAALAGLIVPAVVTNIVQAFRNGVGAAFASSRAHRRYLISFLLFIAISAQFVPILPGWTLFLALGLIVTFFACLQLLGWQPKIRKENRNAAEIGIGVVAGTTGGMSGVWGPPTVLYLTALETEKTEQMRVQGIVYGLGAAMLLIAHSGSGILTTQSLMFSASLLPAALAGMAIGYSAQSRMDQRKFRRATLIVLIVAGLNLLRRGFGL